MGYVDALSRAPIDEYNDVETEVLEGKLEVLLIVNEEENVISMQHTNPKLKRIMEILSCKESECSIEDQATIKGYLIRAEMLYNEVNVNKGQRTLWVLLDAMRKSINSAFSRYIGTFYSRQDCV